MVLAIDLIEAPHAVHFAPNRETSSGMTGGKGSNNSLRTSFDQKRNVFVHGVCPQCIIPEAVCSRQGEVPVGEVHRRRLLTKTHMQTPTVVPGVVAYARAVNSV